MKNLIKNLTIGAIVALAGCSEDEPISRVETPFINPETSDYYKGTQSPGDVWEWTLDKAQQHMAASWDGGTFDDTSDDVSIEGTYEVLPSGYFKVTITKAEPENAEIPDDGSAWFYALEIPGMVMVIKPEGSIKGDMIAMVAQGECADVAGSYNYVKLAASTSAAEYDPSTEEAYGLATFTASGDGYSISGTSYSLDCIDGGCTNNKQISGFPTATCIDGGEVIIEEAGQTVTEGQFTASGAMMLDLGYGNGGVFAMKTSAVPSKAHLKDNTYMGLASIPFSQNDRTVPVQVSFTEDGDGNMIGNAVPFSNIETGAVEQSEAAVMNINSIIDGKGEGSMTFSNSNITAPLVAAMGVNGSDEVIILSSFSPGDNDPFLVFLTKK